MTVSEILSAAVMDSTTIRGALSATARRIETVSIADQRLAPPS